MSYLFDDAKYQYAKNNADTIDWQYFVDRSDDFPDYHDLANPRLVGGSLEHQFWRAYFIKRYGGKRRTLPIIVRVINSYLIAEERKKCQQAGGTVS